jgi:hypothetical protein
MLGAPVAWWRRSKKDKFKAGDIVLILWGVSEITGSGYVVDEPTTVSLPIDEVCRAVAA